MHVSPARLAVPALALALAALVVNACGGSGAAATTQPEMLLRAYDVPAAHAQELRNIVSSLLWRGDNQPRGGNVVVAPTGQLLVSAPAVFHGGVEQLVADLKKAPPPGPAAIAIEYWILQGLPSSTASMADDVPADAKDALAKLGADKLAVTVWDHSRMVSLTNERARVERRGARIEQTAAQHGDTVVADVEVATDVGKLQLRTALPVDKTIVLAQAANTAPDGAAANGSVFYVVRASLAQ